MKILLICLALLLVSCKFVGHVLTRTGESDTRPALGSRDRIEVTRRETSNYRCADGGPLYCKSWDGFHFECDCRR